MSFSLTFKNIIESSKWDVITIQIGVFPNFCFKNLEKCTVITHNNVNVHHIDDTSTLTR